jgi:hypothetical protein
MADEIAIELRGESWQALPVAETATSGKGSAN